MIIYIVFLVIILLIVSQVFVLQKRYSIFRFKHILSVVLFVITIFAVRILLFGNRAIWDFYHKQTKNILRERQLRLIKYQEQKYNKQSFPKKRYLVIGSSQINRIFRNDGLQIYDTELLSLPGLMPWEYVFFQQNIRRIKPDYIIIYVSEFDIARDIKIEKLMVTPKHWPSAINLIQRMYQHNSMCNNCIENVGRVIMSYIFPEYKFNFIFSALLKKFIGYRDKNDQNEIRKDIKQKPLAQRAKSPKELLARKLQRRPKFFENRLNRKEIGVNIVLLEDFIQFCIKENITVIMLDGAYNPMIYSDRLRKMNKRVRAKICKIAEKYTHTTFVSGHKLYQFQIEEYMDATHVTEDAGNRYVKELFEYLEDSGSFAK